MSEKQTMTRGQLAEFVSGQIKEFVGAELATIVQENIAKAVAPLQKQVTDWGGKIMSGIAPRTETGREPGLALARCVRAMATAKWSGQDVQAVLKQWGDHDLAAAYAESRQKALAAGDATAGGFLVPTQFSQDFIALLRSVTVMRKLGTPTLPLPTGTIKLPKATAGATAGYIGENNNAPKSQLAVGQVTLTFKKLACLTPVSNDLLRYSSPGADMIVRNDLLASMAIKEDAAFIRGNGMDGSPKGLLNWAVAANKIAANGTVSNQNTATDLGRLMQQLMGADIPMTKPVWIFSPRTKNYLITLQNSNGFFVYKDEMSTGTLWGYPYAITTAIPTNLDTSGAGTLNESEIYFLDVGQAVIGEALNITVDSSQEAAYFDGSSVQAAFSLDQTVVRALAEHDFAMRYDGAVSILQSVTWAPGSV